MEQFIAWFIVANIVGLFLLPFAKLKPDRLYFLPLIIGAIALASAVYKGIQAAKEAKAARAIHPNDPTYQVSPYAQANLGLSQSLFNGRMAGAANLQQNIEGAQANTIGNINRNATSSAQALALAQQAQGQTDNQFNNLAIQEEQDKQQKAAQLYRANQDMTGENDKVYNDLLRKYGNDVNAKVALKKASAANVSGIFSDLTSAAAAYGSMSGASGSSMGGTTINSANVGGAYPTYDVASAAGPAPMNNPQVTPYATTLQNMYFDIGSGRWLRR